VEEPKVKGWGVVRGMTDRSREGYNLKAKELVKKGKNDGISLKGSVGSSRHNRNGKRAASVGRSDAELVTQKR